MRDLMREYERSRYPADRRLDVQAEGPQTARERVLQWIQSRAHEEPGGDFLLIVSRGGRPGAAPGAVETEVRRLLEELEGRLVEWWQPFAPGSLAVRLAAEPSMFRAAQPAKVDTGDGRTRDTAGAARPLPVHDIPPDLFATVQRVAELRIEREGLSSRVLDVFLREVWNEAQVRAMEDRVSFGSALECALEEELQVRLDE
jgi:hypothetical protein